MDSSAVLRKVRWHLGDPDDPFRAVFPGDSETTWFDLPKENIESAGLTVSTYGTGGETVLTADQYTLTSSLGTLRLDSPVAAGDTLVVEGVSHALYTDAEINEFIEEAVIQHTYGRSHTERYRTAEGFIKYRDNPMTLENLPEVEEPLVAMLATIQILWSLSTDAATDTDIVTAEGTHVNRSQRWAQLQNQIDFLTQRYRELCLQLNVGLFRAEVFTIRRVSKATGRLVPVFKPREYDEYSLPQRELPPRENHNPDESGIPSPRWIRGGY